MKDKLLNILFVVAILALFGFACKIAWELGGSIHEWTKEELDTKSKPIVHQKKLDDHLRAAQMVHEGFHLGGVPHSHLMQIVPKRRGKMGSSPLSQDLEEQLDDIAVLDADLAELVGEKKAQFNQCLDGFKVRAFREKGELP